MLLTYVDESYDDDRYWNAALSCPDSAIASLSSALDEVMKRAQAAHGAIHWESELHGYDLFHGTGPWAPLKTQPRARIGICANALTAVAEHPVEILIRGVDRKRLHERYIDPWHPHAVVMGHLLERIDERAAARGEYALVIADEVDAAATYRRDLWTFQRSATPGYRARRLTQIVDAMLFAPSDASRLLQAVDLVAFLYQRIQRGETDDRARRANDALWGRVSGRVVHARCWFP